MYGKLNENRQKSLWFDLEQLLTDYANPKMRLTTISNAANTSHEILYDLLDADEVIIFGHSLGKVDYHYFQKFFQKQCQEYMERSQGKKITIFTYDELSRRAILKQLREMNQNRTDLLYNQNELNIFMTNGSDEDKISHFLSVFSKRIRRNYINDAISNVLTTC